VYDVGDEKYTRWWLQLRDLSHLIVINNNNNKIQAYATVTAPVLCGRETKSLT
jgi:hypothetical protein